MSLEKQILSACLSHDFYKDTVEVVSKEMFANGVGTIFDTISFAQQKYQA